MVEYLSNSNNFQAKELLYTRVRAQENRMGKDDFIQRLPDTPVDYVYHKEWQMRKHSLEYLLRYLRSGTSQHMKNILDLGCGNGWMSHHLAQLPHTNVWAVDLNEQELKQGDRIFARDNLRFYYADVLEQLLPENQFDIIVLAASVQYFPDLPQLMEALRRVAVPGGEVHMLDSPFYKDESARSAAAARSRIYYEQAAVPEMSGYYHHHLYADLDAFQWENMNTGLWTKWRQKTGYLPPFPWIRIRI